MRIGNRSGNPQLPAHLPVSLKLCSLGLCGQVLGYETRSQVVDANAAADFVL
jgi:hypothetical protein